MTRVHDRRTVKETGSQHESGPGPMEPIVRNRTTTAAIILSLAAAGAPAASAKPADFVPPSHQTPASVYSRPDKSMIPISSPYPSGSNPTPATVPQAVVRVQTPQGGFDWGDAGIGAAGGLALSLIALGGGLAASSQRRGRRTRHSTA